MTESGPAASSPPLRAPIVREHVAIPVVKRQYDQINLSAPLNQKIKGHHAGLRRDAGYESDEAKLQLDQERFKFMIQELTKYWETRKPGRLEARHRNHMNRDAFVAALQSAGVTNARPESFKSVPTIRSQLQAEFMHLHYAKEGEDFFPSKMILIHTPDTASSVAATNALYLAQLATSAHDDRLLRNAARAHRGALQLLRRDLSKPNACYDDHVFGTIHILSLCEAFNGIAIDYAGQNKHTREAAMLFHARGPSSLRSMYMMIQLQQHHHRVLLEGLLSRRRPLIGKGDWLDIDKNCYLRLTSLTTLALSVPGALEDSDELLARASNANLNEIMDMLSNLKSIETRLQNWMTAWLTTMKPSPYWKVPCCAYPWLPHSNVFASAQQFPTPLAAKAHVLFWMPLLCLREAIKQVAEMHPYPLLATAMPQQSENLHGSIAECAEGLCMTAMFLINPVNGIDGCMEACGPLLVASRWFQRVRDHEKLHWCCQMFERIESQGIRVPQVRSSVKLPRALPP
jgi:hypothetical protein